jgi:hypothetical protein
MNILFKSWISSLKNLAPITFFSFLKNSAKRFAHASILTFKIFKWLLVADIAIFFLVGNKLIGLLGAGQDLSPTAMMIQFATSIIWFVLGTAMLLFAIKPEDSVSPLDYFKITSIRFIQLSFFAMVLFLILTASLFSLGITMIPQIPWILLAVAKTLELLVVFFWLASTFSFKEIFVSIEQAANFLLYNLPFILILILILWGLNFLIELAFINHKAIEIITQTAARNYATQNVTQQVIAKISIGEVLAFKYIKFFLDAMWICFLFTFFNQKQGEVYSTTLFK